jgi:DNA modification methylase
MIDRITEQPFCQTDVMCSVLVNADCFDYMTTIQDKSVDFVCIDPPYELDNHGGGQNKEMKRQLNDLHIDFISKGFDIEKVFTEIEGVSKVMNMVCFCSNKQVSKIMNYWEQKKAFSYIACMG